MLSDAGRLRQKWWLLFGGMVLLEVVLIGFGIVLGTGGHSLGDEMTKRLEALTQAFQTITALAVVGAVAIGRARLTPQIVHDDESLMRETMLCMAIGEMGVLLGLVGLAKLHLPEFLITASLVVTVNLGFILPKCLKLLNGLTNKKL